MLKDSEPVTITLDFATASYLAAALMCLQGVKENNTDKINKGANFAHILENTKARDKVKVMIDVINNEYNRHWEMRRGG
jgi:hypothetical protein